MLLPNIELQLRGENHPIVAEDYNKVGDVYSAEGDYDKGLKYYNKSVIIWEKNSRRGKS